MTFPPLRRTPGGLLAAGRRIATWHVASHREAQRNALVASTTLTRRRQELLEVEEFLAEHAARRRQVTAPGRWVARRSA